MSKRVKSTLKNRVRSELGAIDLRVVIVSAVICLILGILSAFAAGGFDMYGQIYLPASAPPAFIFPIIWSVLYLLIGAATGIVIASHDKCFDVQKKRGLLYFAVMFALNLIWAPVFFGCGLFFVGFVIICAMIVLTFFVLLCYSNISFVSAAIIFIYWLWLLFAAYLNLAILFLNS
ncbi:MAG: tryptophan-rich sensory protein [Clostridia bacterium]|nr:tryptophan-rich sensory protein [Clostridia bacterium]